RRGHAAHRCAAGAGPGGGIPVAARPGARPTLLHPARLLDRAPRMAVGEDRARLQRLRAVPTMRPARGAAATFGGSTDRRRPGAAAPCGRCRVTETADVIRSVAGGVTAPRGFKAAGVACGIKKRRNAVQPPLDLALLVADELVPT